MHPALTFVEKLVTDVHCAENHLNKREFTFLENFHKKSPMKHFCRGWGSGAFQFITQDFDIGTGKSQERQVLTKYREIIFIVSYQESIFTRKLQGKFLTEH